MKVRRWFIFIEESLDHATQWAVFQPNEPRFTPNRAEEFDASEVHRFR